MALCSVRLAWTALAVALAACLAPASGRAQTEVDLALVLAVDISYSMDPEEQVLQRQGFIEAFRSPTVHEAIKRGMLGKIAVVYAEWAGAWDRKVVVPWTLIESPADAVAFSDRLVEAPTRRAQRTSIAGAIDFGMELLGQSGVEATRRVIDVSGDGPNNQGRLVTQARDDALNAGVTINGLPIELKRPGYLDIQDLDLYYRDCVIGGPGAFMVPVRERDQFVQAIKTKIILEIAGVAPADPWLERRGDLLPAQAAPAQAERKANCLVGEYQWRDRMGN